MKGCLFLCLLFSPAGASGPPKIHSPEYVRQDEGAVSMPDNTEADGTFMMQAAGQAHFNRIPAWSLSRVPRIRIRRELHPLEEVGSSDARIVHGNLYTEACRVPRGSS